MTTAAWTRAVTTPPNAAQCRVCVNAGCSMLHRRVCATVCANACRVCASCELARTCALACMLRTSVLACGKRACRDQASREPDHLRVGLRESMLFVMCKCTRLRVYMWTRESGVCTLDTFPCKRVWTSCVMLYNVICLVIEHHSLHTSVVWK